MTDAYVHIVSDPGAVMEAADRIGDLDAVEQIHVVTGEYDIIAFVSTDENDIPHVVAHEIHDVPGVIDTVTNVAYEA